MKKSVFLYLLPLALLAVSCQADEIDFADDSTDSGTTELTDPGLAWSASTCEATIGATNTFPTLTNEYGVSVVYTSSDADVATIDTDGSITLLAAGTTTITASNTATSVYSASSAAYTLTVSKSTDTISWSAETCTATLDENNTFPTLNNPGNQTIT